MLGNLLGVRARRRLHGANLCKRLDRADRRSTAGLVVASPRVMQWRVKGV